MGYGELLQALEEEVGRQIRERRREAEHQQRQFLETTRAEIAARRDQVIAEEKRRLMGESARALSRAHLEQARAILGEMRQRMADLRSAAEARLPSINDPDLLARCVDEVVPDLGDGPILFRVKPGCESTLERHLRARHPALVPRSTIEGSPEISGGVEILITGQSFDNTLRSRLSAAWDQLEPEIAVLLFEPEGAASPDRSIAGGKYVEVAGVS
jgi:vacuolar-type H+-ATPase subunit E/Vma4